jgi:SAM-dependent methyltransferase
MENGSLESARVIVPLLVSRYNPRSVADIGCGTGSFANEFLKMGIEDVVGYEGKWVERVPTLLPKGKFIFTDITKPMTVSRSYDLCICLEVAEHLDAKDATALIDLLTSLSTRIVFSAAIPGQGGNHHVNEQWPIYWSRLFREKGFYLEWDPRLDLWNDGNVASCYRQNLLIFSSEVENRVFDPLPLVHPEAWTDAMRVRKISLKIILARKLPPSIFRLRRKLLDLAGRLQFARRKSTS